MALTTPKRMLENVDVEIGKGREFITQTFPSRYEAANRIEKYASAQFVTCASAHGMGKIVQTGTATPHTYTVTPLNPSVTFELPYFSSSSFDVAFSKRHRPA
jgi:hypothetical protein